MSDSELKTSRHSKLSGHGQLQDLANSTCWQSNNRSPITSAISLTEKQLRRTNFSLVALSTFNNMFAMSPLYQ